MKVTIIPEDQFISVDGVGKTLNFQMDPNISSVQWNGEKGTVGLHKGGSRHITSLDEFQPIIDVFNRPVIHPELTVDEAKSIKISQLSQLRFVKENGGFDLNGNIIATDDRSKTLIIGARLEAMENPETFEINWKTSDGFVTLNAEQIIAISNGVRAFVQGCFDNEKVHTENILALNTIQDIADYDIETGW